MKLYRGSNVEIQHIDISLCKPMQIFCNHIRSKCPTITTIELEFLNNKLSVSNLKSKQFYIHANTLQQSIGFVCSGLLRVFYIDNNGNEITVNFIEENHYATHYIALLKHQPSKYYFQSLEPTIIINLPYQHLQECSEIYPHIAHYIRLMIEDVFAMQQHRIESFLFEKAENRYLAFIKENPKLFNRISLSHLCSYLGIERQTLTRIRHKIARQ